MIFPAISLVASLGSLGGPAEAASDEALPIAVSGHPASETAEEFDDELKASALEASPDDLGVAYLVALNLIEMTEIAGGGIQIHTPEGVIDERNAPRKRKEFQSRLDIYHEAIFERGFDDFSGQYSVASVSPSCAKSGSLWLSGPVEGAFESYTIAQEEFTLTLTLSLALKPGMQTDLGSFELEGVAVESSLALADPINSDYFLKGRLLDGRLEIRPRLDVLDGWPKWAGPPEKRDLERCVLVLQRKPSE